MIGGKGYFRILLLICLLVFFITTANFSQQDSSLTPKKEVEEKPETIVPGPVNIKERMGIKVFVVWIWVVIVILVYILRQKIAEVDRLNEIRYFKEKE